MDCCSITELRNKEVINAKSGCRVGFVSDVEINTCDGRLVSIIVWGKCRCFGLFGREDDMRMRLSGYLEVGLLRSKTRCWRCATNAF